MTLELRLDHVVIAVHNLDAATQDYNALLGRRPSWQGSHPTYGTRNTLYRIDNTYVELLALAEAPGRETWAGELTRFLAERGEGLYALALGTGDVDATTREVRKRGLQVADPADGAGIDELSGLKREWRNAQVLVESSRGARIFLIEHRSPEGALRPAPLNAQGGDFVKRLDHAIVLSPDMMETRRLWNDVLGARLALDRTFPDRHTRIMFFRLGDITVEISGGAQQSSEGLGKPDRLWGLAWGVDDLDAMCQRLQAEGIRTSGVRPGIKPGTRVATVREEYTHGVATLLIEHSANSFRAESRAPQGTAYDSAPEQRAFTAKGLDHVVLSTDDAFATAAKWSDTLGLRVAETHQPEGSHLRLARLPVGNAFVELAQPLTPDHRLALSIAERGPGMFSISVEVDNLDAAVADLRSKGIRVSDAEGGVWPGTRLARINKQASNGVSIQLIERG